MIGCPLDDAAGLLAANVVAVPPLPLNAVGRINNEALSAMVAHVAHAGVTAQLFGGNANFYNFSASLFAEALEALASLQGRESWIIPATGPDYGRLCDQAPLIRNSGFALAMVLPTSDASTVAGNEAAIRATVQTLGRPVLLYLKSESYLTVDAVARLIDTGNAAAIKYAIPRVMPEEDAYLDALLGVVDRRLVLSGSGEPLGLSHMQHFGLAGFTAGAVCLAPHISSSVFRFIRAGDWRQAGEMLELLRPLEEARTRWGPVQTLHEAMTMSGVADCGPIMPCLSPLTGGQREALGPIVNDLMVHERALAASDRKSKDAA
jgi:dihydrodipicolinate synthase/N-acetylneuraminate lyase